MNATELYERDFFEWTQCNASLLRAGRFDQADIEHIAEEIEDMGKSERRALESHLIVLLIHLLKWQIQSEHQSVSWRGTIKIQRKDIVKLLGEMPSLMRWLKDNLAEAYEDAVLKASAETGLPQRHFPSSCPFTLEQILDQEFFPE